MGPVAGAGREANGRAVVSTVLRPGNRARSGMRAASAAVLALTLWLVGGWSAGAQAAPSGTPSGNLESAVGVPGGIRIGGWTVDPSTPDPIYVWATVDGAGRHVLANQARADVGAAFPAAGPNHGFSAVLPASAGSHQVCATASNVGPGAHQPLGCRTVRVPGGSPFGNLEAVSGSDGLVSIRGWTIDPDTTAPVYLWVTIDGVGRHVRAAAQRDDVGRAYPAYGSGHGFDAAIPTSTGDHTVCVTASNVGVGSHTPLGCRIATSGTVRQNLRSTEALRTAWAADLCATDRMVTRRVLSTNAVINPKIADAVAALEQALLATGYQAKWTTAYSCRAITGGTAPSLHAYGIAVDIDPAENPYQNPTTWSVRFSAGLTRAVRAADVAAKNADTIFTPAQVAAVEAIRTVDGKQVWAWGGRWPGLLDTMHFQINVTPPELARGLVPGTGS